MIYEEEYKRELEIIEGWKKRHDELMANGTWERWDKVNLALMDGKRVTLGPYGDLSYKEGDIMLSIPNTPPIPIKLGLVEFAELEPYIVILDNK